MSTNCAKILSRLASQAALALRRYFDSIPGVAASLRLSFMVDLSRETALPPEVQMEMFILGYCAELRSLRRLQYLYKRDTRNFWNEIFCPDIPEETLHYYDTDYVIHGEVQSHLDSGELDLSVHLGRM